MDKKLIIASVVIVGLTVFYFKVVKKKSASTSSLNQASSTTLNSANLPSNFGQKAISKVNKQKPTSGSTTATMKVATAQVPSNSVRTNNALTSTTNPCPSGFSYNPLFMNCVKQF